MSESVSDFQAQVASVMDVLLKTAVKEITKLFEERYNAFGGCITQTETVEKPREISLSDVRTQLDSALKYSTDKSLCSVGVQVGKEWTPQTTTETPPPQLPTPLAHTGDSPEGMEVASITDHDQKEESLETVDLHCTVDLPCTALKDRDGESGTSQSNIVSGKQQPEQPSVADAPKELDNVFDYLRKTLGWSDPQQTADIPEAAAVDKEASTENEDQVTEDDVDDNQPETPTSTSTSTSQSDQSVTSSSPASDPATPVQVEECLPAFREVMHFQLGVDPRDWKLLQPCSVQLVDMRLLSGSRRCTFRQVGPKGSSRPKDLRSHHGLHTGRRLCCFTECGSGVWRVHRVPSAAAAAALPGSPLACKICSKTFKRRKLLRRHERFHTGERPYACHLCRKSFTLRKSLRRHLRFHTGEKPHGCLHCGKCFRLKDNLKTHLRFHTGERPFACTLCPKSFRLLKNLEMHRATH